MIHRYAPAIIDELRCVRFYPGVNSHAALVTLARAFAHALCSGITEASWTSTCACTMVFFRSLDTASKVRFQQYAVFWLKFHFTRIQLITSGRYEGLGFLGFFVVFFHFVLTRARSRRACGGDDNFL